MAQKKTRTHDAAAVRAAARKRTFKAFNDIYLAATASRSPSVETVMYLADAWFRYLQIGRKESMDGVLGLDAGRGQDPGAKDLEVGVRNFVYCDRIGSLVRAGFSVDDAAEIVAYKENNFLSVLSRWNLKALSAKSARALFIREVGARRAKKESAVLTSDELAKYLEGVPASVLPDPSKGKGTEKDK